MLPPNAAYRATFARGSAASPNAETLAATTPTAVAHNIRTSQTSRLGAYDTACLSPVYLET
jgi:hypothetical protein